MAQPPAAQGRPQPMARDVQRPDGASFAEAVEVGEESIDSNTFFDEDDPAAGHDGQ